MTVKVQALLHDGRNSRVYLAHRGDSGHEVVLKTMATEQPTPTQVSKFNNEYELTRELDVPFCRRALQKERHRGRFAIVLEYIPGSTLAEVLTGRELPLTEALALVTALGETLGRLHERGIIHKDVNPNNVILDEAERPHLIDFGNAARFSLKEPYIQNPSHLEGTLPFIAPEQTGRMNRVVDARSDLYSLGVILYRLLAHRLPFETKNPLELVHCHLAKVPEPVAAVRPSVPRVLSDLVDKLLAKNAEERYQTAFGLVADLETCRAQLDSDRAPEPLVLGQHDKSDRLLLPEKLYGREPELEALLAALERVHATGDNELLLVCGYSGTGKTSVVQELYRPLTQRRGLFLTGKFGAFGRSAPYAAFIDAFDSLVGRILSEDPEQLEAWESTLTEALQPNGRVLVDVLPRLELVIGPQPPVPQLGHVESRNRLELMFQRLADLIAGPDRPLVVFLDDLQWADSGSLGLLEALCRPRKGGHTLLVGAFRDNEVGARHPLAQTLDAIESTGARVARLHLQGLDESSTHALIADCLASEDHAETRALATLVYQKTLGNCAYTLEFLKSLHERGLLRFDRASQRWIWDTEAIRASVVTDNVVDLLTQRIDEMPPATRKLLNLAGCIGNEFDIQTLALVFERPIHETMDALSTAIEAGMVVPLDPTYRAIGLDAATDRQNQARFRFVHDKVQQASYEHVTEAERAEAHLRIGRLLIQATAHQEHPAIGADIFAIVNQLNAGRHLIAERAELNQLASLNLEAAQKARALAAFQAAADYAEVGLDALPSERWESHYDATLALHTIGGSVHIPLGNFARSETLLRAAIAGARTALEKVEPYALLMAGAMATADFVKSVETGRTALRLFGVDFPDAEEGLEPMIDTYLEEIATLLEEGPFVLEEVLAWPETRDPDKLAISKLAQYVGDPCNMLGWVNRWALAALIATKQALTDGITATSPFAFAQYGLMLSLRGSRQEGYEVTRMAYALSERWGSETLHQKVRCGAVLSAYVMPWVKPFEDANEVLRMVVGIATDIGDHVWGGYHAFNSAMTSHAQGKPLSVTIERLDRLIPQFTHGLKSDQSALFAETTRVLIAYLAQDAVWGEHAEEACASWLARMRAIDNVSSLRAYLVVRAQCDCLLGEYEQARAHVVESFGYPVGQGLAWLESIERFYFGLALLKLARATGDEGERRRYLEQLTPCYQQLGRLAEINPVNFKTKRLILDAEMAALSGDHLRALRTFGQAIDWASRSKALPEQALANELAGELCSSLDMDRVADSFLSEAHYVYGFWGARLKQRQMEARYAGRLHTRRSSPGTSSSLKAESSTVVGDRSLDLLSVLKASQAVGGQIILSSLLEELMRVVVENAGAQAGAVVLVRDDELTIEAQLDPERSSVLEGIAVTGSGQLPETLLAYVARTREDVVLADAINDQRFGADPYFAQRAVRSVMCVPVMSKNELLALLYLENNLAPSAFTRDRVEVLRLLSGQIAVSLENAILYAELETRVEERTRELAARNAELERSRDELMASHRQMQALFSAYAQALPGAELDGKYALLELIGSGSFGAVYRARQLNLDREVAIKVFRPSRERLNPSSLERFRLEGVSACRIQHENAVSVLDFNISSDNVPYLVMELLSGRTLAAALEEDGPLTLGASLEVVQQTAGVLAAAHAAGVVHRDVKPENIFMQERPDGSPCVKVLDFGIAKIATEIDPDLAALTQTGQAMGTPYYMAPERISEPGGDERVDIYSLGVVLYEILTGRRPFSSKAGLSLWEIIGRQALEEPRSLADDIPELPPEISTLGLRMLAKKQEERPSAAEVAAAIERIREMMSSDPTWAAALERAQPNPHAGPSALSEELVGSATDRLHPENIFEQLPLGRTLVPDEPDSK